MRGSWWHRAAGSALLAVGVLGGVQLAGVLEPPPGRIASGVRAGGAGVGGLTREEAVGVLRAQARREAQVPLTLRSSGRAWTFTAAELRAWHSARRAATEAYGVGRAPRGGPDGALAARLGLVDVALPWRVPRTDAREALAAAALALYQPSVDARRCGSVILPGRWGQQLDLGGTCARLEAALTARRRAVDAALEPVPPQVSSDALRRHPKLLGRQTIPCDRSASGAQQHNLRLLCAGWNGLAIGPGEAVEFPAQVGGELPCFARSGRAPGSVSLWGGTEALRDALRQAGGRGTLASRNDRAFGLGAALRNMSGRSLLVTIRQAGGQILLELWSSEQPAPRGEQAQREEAEGLLQNCLEGPNAHPARQSRPTVTLALVGDVQLEGAVRGALGGIAPVLRQADIAFCNLESPLARHAAPTPTKTAADLAAGREFLFRASPDAAGELKRAGFAVVSLANNHALDYGKDGLRQTTVALDRAGVRWCGAGPTDAESRQATVLAIRGWRVAFLAFACDDTLPRSAREAPAGQGWGVATLKTTTPEGARRACQVVRNAVGQSRREADGVVVSLHWGRERSSLPDAVQRRLAESAVEAGADLVVGHHPHVLQPLEYPGALVAYSLGNFLFPGAGPAPQRRSALLLVRWSGGTRDVMALPVERAEARPRVLTAPPEQLAAVERELGTAAQGQ